MSGLKQKIFWAIFWTGYIMVFVTTFVSFKNDLHKRTINFISLKFHLDQVLHALVYFLIIMYLFAGQYNGFSLFKENSFNKLLLLILLLAIVTEVIQLVVPSRAFNIFDLLANLIGIGVGLVVMRIVSNRKAPYKKLFISVEK